jgi:hypothetical protein
MAPDIYHLSYITSLTSRRQFLAMAAGPAQDNSIATAERPAAVPDGGRSASDPTHSPANHSLAKGGPANLARKIGPPLPLLKSFTILLCLILTASYAIIWAFYPWRPLAELDVPGWIVDFADQVDLMMTKRNPPVVILGSSLTLAAPRRPARPNVYQEEISKRSCQNIAISCMAVPGAIASDQDFILSELLAHGKKPALVIYTYAPRDFMDNTVVGKITATPTRRVLTFINRRNSFLPRDLSLTALNQCFDNHAAFLDLVRRHVLRGARTYVCKISGHPDTLWAASRKQSGQTPTTATNAENETSTGGGRDRSSASGAAPGSNEGADQRPDEAAPVRAKALREDLDLYSRRYNPQNALRIGEQYQHVEDLLRLGKDNGIQIDLIGMPVSPANLNLLKAGVYQNMDHRLHELATKYGADIYDLNQDQGVKFGQDQYLDSVHLSNGGARQFVPVFVDKVVQSPNFKKAFPAKRQ